MKMTADDIKNHKKLHYYVSVNIPQAGDVPAIVNALKKYSGNTSEAKLKEALRWNRGPTIQIVENLVCAGVEASGCYRDDSDVIRVDAQDVENFEAGRDLKHTESGKLVYYLGVTLLHEFCHWANDGSADDKDQTHEKFEQMLYGRIINRSDK